MSTRNSTTFKPLVNAGISILTIRFVMLIYTGLLSPLLVILGLSFDTYQILIEISVAIGFIATLLFVIFILSSLMRINDNPNILPEKRDQIKLGIISSVILIIILSIFAIVYLVLEVLYLYGVISLPVILAQILLFSLIGLELLNGIFIMITFIVLSNILDNFNQLRDLKIFRTFTLLFGIFLGLSHFLLGVYFVFTLLPISNPIIIQIISFGFYGISIFSAIASLCQIIISVGYILIGKRLQTTQ